MFDLIIFGTGFWFWAILGVWLVLEFIFTWNEKYTQVTVVMICTLVVIWLFAKSTFAPFTFIYENPLLCLAIALGYIVIGVVWSVFKWWFKLKKWKLTYDELKENFLRGNHIQKGLLIPPELKTKFREFIENDHSYTWSHRVPDPKYYKDKITGWIAYWPISLFCTVLGDFIVDLAKMIYRKISFIYELITQKMKDSIKVDIE